MGYWSITHRGTVVPGDSVPASEGPDSTSAHSHTWGWVGTGWCTRELHRRDEARGGRENDKAASQREVGVWSQMYAPQRQAPMPQPCCTLCPVLLCHWRLPGSTYKWGAAFSFVFFLMRWRLLAALNWSEGQTPYDCALLGAMETGKQGQTGSVGIYHHLRGNASARLPLCIVLSRCDLQFIHP